MDHYVVVGYFVTVLACIWGIIWLSNKGKITGPVLLSAVFVVVSIMALASWKQPMPEGVLPALTAVLGYVFGILTKKEPA